MNPGDKVFVSGGYDMEPRWLCGRRGYHGVIEAMMPGQNADPAALVKLVAPISVDGVTGEYLVMELRYVGATWKGPSATAHVELCDFMPEAKPWKDRRQGKWVESHATIELERHAIARGAV